MSHPTEVVSCKRDFEVGERIDARFGGGTSYYPGTIIGKGALGLDILYDDGDKEKNVGIGFVRKANHLSTKASPNNTSMEKSTESSAIKVDEGASAEDSPVKSAEGPCEGDIADGRLEEVTDVAKNRTESVSAIPLREQENQSDELSNALEEVRSKDKRQHSYAYETEQDLIQNSTDNGSASLRRKMERRRRRCPSIAMDYSYSGYEDKDGEDLDMSLKRLIMAGNASCVAKRLQSVGFDVTEVDSHGWTPLHWASSRGDPHIIELMLRTLRAMHPEDAGSNGSDESTKQLGDNLNVREGINGWTPLHLASIGGHLDAVYLLMHEGCNPDIKDNIGDRPVDCMKTSGGGPQTQTSFLRNALLDLSDDDSHVYSSDKDQDKNDQGTGYSDYTNAWQGTAPRKGSRAGTVPRRQKQHTIPLHSGKRSAGSRAGSKG